MPSSARQETTKRVSRRAVVNIIILLLIAYLVRQGFAAGVHAEAGHGHEAPALGSLVWPAANFLLFLLLLSYAYFKFARPQIVRREVSVRDHLVHSAETLQSSEAEFQELTRRLERIVEEKKAIAAQFEDEAKSIAAAIEAAARNSAEAIKKDLSRRVASELGRAKAEIRAEIVQRALQIARERSTRELTAERDAELRWQTITAIGNSKY